jgi:hypothetical protein
MLVRLQGSEMGSFFANLANVYNRATTVPAALRPIVASIAPALVPGAVAESPIAVIPPTGKFPAWLPWAAGGVAAVGVVLLVAHRRRKRGA